MPIHNRWRRYPEHRDSVFNQEQDGVGAGVVRRQS